MPVYCGVDFHAHQQAALPSGSKMLPDIVRLCETTANILY